MSYKNKKLLWRGLTYFIAGHKHVSFQQLNIEVWNQPHEANFSVGFIFHPKGNIRVNILRITTENRNQKPKTYEQKSTAFTSGTLYIHTLKPLTVTFKGRL